jgi:hypothetical protein
MLVRKLFHPLFCHAHTLINGEKIPLACLHFIMNFDSFIENQSLKTKSMFAPILVQNQIWVIVIL